MLPNIGPSPLVSPYGTKYTHTVFVNHEYAYLMIAIHSRTSTPSSRLGHWSQGDENFIVESSTNSQSDMGFSFRYSEWIVFEGISVDEKGKQHYLDATIAYKMAVLNCIHYLSQVSVAMLGCKWHLQLPHFVTTFSLVIPRSRCIFSCRAALAREESVVSSMCLTLYVR